MALFYIFTRYNSLFEYIKRLKNEKTNTIKPKNKINSWVLYDIFISAVNDVNCVFLVF